MTALWFLAGAVLGIIAGAGCGVWLVLALDQIVTARDVFYEE